MLAPHIVVWVLHLPDVAEQGEHYFRLLGLLVGGVGMLYVVSGRMSAEGFVFASLLDRPLVPPAMALLWHFDIVPGPLALAFFIQDFGSFPWTLTTWLRERRPSTTALLERGDTFSDDLDSPSIRAIQAIYSAAMLEELKMFQVVDKLVALFRGGALPLGRGEGADKLRQYGEKATRRLPESERRAVYQIRDRGTRHVAGHRAGGDARPGRRGEHRAAANAAILWRDDPALAGREGGQICSRVERLRPGSRRDRAPCDSEPRWRHPPERLRSGPGGGAVARRFRMRVTQSVATRGRRRYIGTWRPAKLRVPALSVGSAEGIGNGHE